MSNLCYFIMSLFTFDQSGRLYQTDPTLNRAPLSPSRAERCPF